jgi:hypothetical protein
LSDETNLVSTSLLMYRKQKLQAVLEMLGYYDTFHVTVVGPAHRPAEAMSARFQAETS